MKSITILKRLEKNAAEKKINKNTSAYRLIVKACELGEPTIRTCWTSGIGRFVKNMDYTDDVCKMLALINVQFDRGNDAPRGGLTGNFVRIKNFAK